jgi:thioredoxin 1
MFRKTILTFLLILSMINNSQGLFAAPAIFVDSPADAFALAADTKKDLLIIFGANWCVYCNILKNDIKTNLNIVEDKIVCFVDFDQNKDMVKEYRVRTIPDYMLYRDSIEIKRKVGYKNKEKFQEWLLNNE